MPAFLTNWIGLHATLCYDVMCLTDATTATNGVHVSRYIGALIKRKSGEGRDYVWPFT